MSNSWMTHATSAEADRSSEELQLDSGWVSERTKHNPQEYNDINTVNKFFLGGLWIHVIAPSTANKVIFV